MQLPVVIVTGTIHVEGGEENSVRRVPDNFTPHSRSHSEEIQIVQKRTISPDRRAANVISTGYMRRLRGLRLARTPFGSLVDRRRLSDVRSLIEEAGRDVAVFNRSHETARLVNTFLWENLEDNRLAAVEGWLAAERRHNPEAKTILGWLQGKIELPLLESAA